VFNCCHALVVLFDVFNKFVFVSTIALCFAHSDAVEEIDGPPFKFVLT
jgi:hypothetical protein